MVGTQIRTYTFWLYPLALSFTPGAPQEVSSGLVQAIRDPGMALFTGGPKQNPRPGLPIHAPNTASLQTPSTTWPGPHSPVLRHGLSTGRGPSLRACCGHPTAITPERSLLAASVRGACPSLEDTVMFRLCCRPPMADIITTGSQAAHSQSQEITCSVTCPIYPSTQTRPTPAPALLPIRLLQHNSQLFLPARAKGSLPLLN